MLIVVRGFYTWELLVTQKQRSYISTIFAFSLDSRKLNVVFVTALSLAVDDTLTAILTYTV